MPNIINKLQTRQFTGTGTLIKPENRDARKIHMKHRAAVRERKVHPLHRHLVGYVPRVPVRIYGLAVPAAPSDLTNKINGLERKPEQIRSELRGINRTPGTKTDANSDLAADTAEIWRSAAASFSALSVSR